MNNNKLIAALELNLYQSTLNIRSGRITIEEIGSFLPGILHLNNIDINSLSIEYINYGAALFLNYEDEEVYNGLFFLKRAIEKNCLNNSFRLYQHFKEAVDNDKFIVHNQDIKHNSSGEYIRFLTFKKSYGEKHTLSFTFPWARRLDIDKFLNYKVAENEIPLELFAAFKQLTKREKELLSLFSKGMSPSQIADILFLSRRTVETHRKSVMQKLNARNIYDLIRIADMFGLVEF